MIAQQSSQSRGLDVIGYGYDVFGNYADMSSVKDYPFFEMGSNRTQFIGAFAFDVPKNISLQNISTHKTTIIKGESLRQYARSMSLEAGLGVDAMFFSSSINTSFSSSTSGYSRSNFLTYRDASTKWRISLLDTIDLEKLKESMTKQAKKDIENMDPRKFLEYYGAYYIASAYLGGRAELTVQSNSSGKTSLEELEVLAEGQYKAISVSGSSKESKENTDTSSQYSSTLTVVGGNSEFANNIQNNTQYNKWAEGINEWPVLCDFEAGSLRPVWELASTNDRKAVLMAAFEEMKKESPLPEAFADIIGIQSSQYMIQNVASQLYWNLSGYNFDAIASVGQPVTLYKADAENALDEGLDRIIRILTSPYDDKNVMFQPQHSSLIVATEDKSDRLVLNKQNLKDERNFFKMTPVDDRENTYFIINKKSGLYLTGKKQRNNIYIVLDSPKLDESQMWYFKEMKASDVATPDTDKYIISVADKDKSWDFAGCYPALSNTELLIWKNQKNNNWPADRIISIVADKSKDICFMSPMSHRSAMFSAVSGKTLTLEKCTKTKNQQWKFEYAGIPRGYYIRSIGLKDQAVALKPDKMDQNGAKVVLLPINKTLASQIWVLKKDTSLNHDELIDVGEYHIVTDNGKYIIQIAGASNHNNKNGSNISISSMHNDLDGKVRFLPQYDGSYAIQFQNGKKVLDISGGKSNNKQNIHLWEYKKIKTQYWFLKDVGNNRYNLINVGTHKAADISTGKDYSNGDNIHQWTVHSGVSQKWQIIHIDGSLKGKNM